MGVPGPPITMSGTIQAATKARTIELWNIISPPKAQTPGCARKTQEISELTIRLLIPVLELQLRSPAPLKGIDDRTGGVERPRPRSRSGRCERIGIRRGVKSPVSNRALRRATRAAVLPVGEGEGERGGRPRLPLQLDPPREGVGVQLETSVAGDGEESVWTPEGRCRARVASRSAA